MVREMRGRTEEASSVPTYNVRAHRHVQVEKAAAVSLQ
jgi:hypothetical protein